MTTPHPPILPTNGSGLPLSPGPRTVWPAILYGATVAWVAAMVASLYWHFLDYVVWGHAAAVGMGQDFFQVPRGYLNLLAGNNIFFTEISDYAPFASVYHNHPFVAVAVGPWTAPLPPWVAFSVFVGVSLGLLLLSARLLASIFQSPTDKAFCYFVTFCGLPVYVLLWNAQMHVFVILAVVLILAGLIRWEQEPSSADRYLRWIQLGLLISLLSKPIVLLMLPALLAVPEIRRKLILPVAVYAAVSLLMLLAPRLNPGGYNGVHWQFLFSGSLEVKPLGAFVFPGRDDFTDCFCVYSLPMLLYRACGGARILPFAKLPLAAIAGMSLTPLFLSGRSRRIRAALVAVTLCVLSFFLSYCIVFEYNYAALMPVLPVILWLWRQETTPWLRRLLMGLLLVSLAVFLPTPVLVDPPQPNRFWVHSTVERVAPVLVVFLGLLVYGMAFFGRAWRGRKPAVRRLVHGVWAPLCRGCLLGALLGAVLAAAYLTLPGRMRLSSREWTRETWLTHLTDVLSRPGIAPAKSAEIHQALASLYLPARPEAALEHLQKAAAAGLDSAGAHSAQGHIFLVLGKFDEAIEQSQRALELDPRFAQAHHTLAAALAARGRVDEAIEHFRRAIDLEPEPAEAHNNLGVALAGRGRFDEAMVHYRKALEIKPGYAEAHYNLGLALAGCGRIEEAIAQYQKALHLEPDYAMALNDLAWWRATCPDAALRDGAAAVELARRAIALSGGKAPEMLDTLAAAYAEEGMFAQATETVSQALDLARRQNKTVLVEKLKARLWLYDVVEAPYREALRPSAP